MGLLPLTQISQTSQVGGDMVGLIVLGFLVIGGITAYTIWNRNQAKENYDAAYSRFVANPTDAKLRDTALAEAEYYAKSVGGDYSERDMHRTTLRQSIESMHRSAKQAAEVKNLVTAKSVGPADRLAELQKMFDQGLISEQEFQSKRTQILDEV